MASITGSYNPEATPAEASSLYIPLPAGEYTLEIVESDYVSTSNGLGMVLKCKAQIVGGDYDQRPYYLNYNLENETPETGTITQEIGQREFAGLRRAVGVLAPDDTEQLHFKPFRVKIGVQEKKIKVNGVKRGTGEMENTVKQYLFEDEAAPRSVSKRASRTQARSKPWAA